MKKQRKQPSNYDDAWAELQQIVRELQAETIGIDQLAERIERASRLANFCRERLRQTEAKLENL